jgi:hypothetical protein
MQKLEELRIESRGKVQPNTKNPYRVQANFYFQGNSGLAVVVLRHVVMEAHQMKRQNMAMRIAMGAKKERVMRIHRYSKFWESKYEVCTSCNSIDRS